MIYFILISANIVSLYLVIVLISFNPSDPGWTQITWFGSVYNIGGLFGARISDFLFFMFGILAYMIPLYFLFCFWKIYLWGICGTVFDYLLRVLGVILLLCVGCGLIHVSVDNVFYFPAGGVIGHLLYDIIISYPIISDHVILVLLLLLVIVNGIFFSNRFFVSVFNVVAVKILNCVYILRGILLKCIKNIYQYVYRKLNDFNDSYFVSCYKQQDIFLKNLTGNLLEKKQYINISQNIAKFVKRSNLNSKDDLNKIAHFKKSGCAYFIVPKNDDGIKGQVINIIPRMDFGDNLDICLRKINLERKQFLDSIDSYEKNLFSTVDMTLINDQKTKRSLISSLHVSNDAICTFDLTDKQRIPTDGVVNQNIKKQCFSFISQDKDNNIEVMSTYPKVITHSYDIENNLDLPSINLLNTSISKREVNDDAIELKNFSYLLELKLSEYHILANVVNIVSGPVITRFELNLSPGVKSSKISNLSRDLARSLLVASVKIIEVIPGTPYIGLEIPNRKRRMVYLHDIINSEMFKKIDTPLALVLGKNTIGKSVIVDLKCMPHLLVAGATGSGKSIGINAMIISILYRATPEEVRFIMIDPKILELSVYSNIPHLLQKVITDTQEVDVILQWCVKEMENRYKLMAACNVKNLEDYNSRIERYTFRQYTTSSNIDAMQTDKINDDCYNKSEKLPYIIVIIDEFADLMMATAKKIEILITRLTQKSRAAGIHLILATQRPSVDVVTGLIKANIPARIAFTVSSKIDSRTILGQAGAESLLGMGDMLYLASNSSKPVRVHGAFVDDKEIDAVVNFWINHANCYKK